ncbi:hypothetical protein [Trichothermofontia sp.]
MIPIYRQTHPDFSVTSSDIDELIAFISGERSQLPAMCEPPHTPDFLPALALLCQQYQESTRVDKLLSITNQPRWWLESLGLLEEGSLNQGAYQRALKCLNEEWLRSPYPNLARSNVDRLLAQLVTEQPTGYEINPPFVSPQIVADAYRTLREMLRISTEDQTLRQPEAASEPPEAILAIDGSFLTAASAAVLAMRLKAQQPNIKRFILKPDALHDRPNLPRHSTLLLTEPQMAHLPTLRLRDFAGAVLVLSLDTFPILKKKHRVLRFAQGSHDALPIPFSLNALLNTATDLVPMEPENLRFFQNEMRAISQIYQHKIVPCLQKLGQPDQRSAALQEVANLIEELRTQTPVACHTPVTIEGKHLQIQQHLRQALASLQEQPGSTACLTYLKEAFNQWYLLVQSAVGENLTLVQQR